MSHEFKIGSAKTQITHGNWDDSTGRVTLVQETGECISLSKEHADRFMQIWRELWDADLNQTKQRLNTLIAMEEWSIRDPEMAWNAIGGLHHDPLPGDKHQSKIQVKHATQQRWYAAIVRLMGANGEHDDAVNRLLDLAWLGLQAEKYNPKFCNDALKNNKAVVGAAVATTDILSAFPGATVR